MRTRSEALLVEVFDPLIFSKYMTCSSLMRVGMTCKELRNLVLDYLYQTLLQRLRRPFSLTWTIVCPHLCDQQEEVVVFAKGTMQCVHCLYYFSMRPPRSLTPMDSTTKELWIERTVMGKRHSMWNPLPHHGMHPGRQSCYHVS